MKISNLIYKIKHYGLKRMIPHIVTKDIYAEDVFCDNPYTAYYQIKKERNLYHFRILKKYQNIYLLLLIELFLME